MNKINVGDVLKGTDCLIKITDIMPDGMVKYTNLKNGKSHMYGLEALKRCSLTKIQE